MNNIKVSFVDLIKDNSRCICGFCDHHILVVYFNNGSKWCPKTKEFTAVKELLYCCVRYNLDNDKNCFISGRNKDITDIL